MAHVVLGASGAPVEQRRVNPDRGPMAPRPQPHDHHPPTPDPSGRALACAFARHGAEVFALARRLLDDGPAAEAVTCEVFVRFAREGTGICTEPGSLRACLLAACHRRCMDDVRTPGAPGSTVPTPGTSASAEPRDETFTLRTRTLLETLPGTDRRAIALTYFRGRTYTEVADALGTSADAVKSCVRAALRRLHDERTGTRV